MSALSVGMSVELPDLGGGWQVWSRASSDFGPGAYFVVRDGVSKVIRARREKGVPRPVITVLA